MLMTTEIRAAPAVSGQVLWHKLYLILTSYPSLLVDQNRFKMLRYTLLIKTNVGVHIDYNVCLMLKPQSL